MFYNKIRDYLLLIGFENRSSDFSAKITTYAICYYCRNDALTMETACRPATTPHYEELTDSIGNP
jgi:hypothetical protein